MFGDSPPYLQAGGHWFDPSTAHWRFPLHALRRQLALVSVIGCTAPSKNIGAPDEPERCNLPRSGKHRDIQPRGLSRLEQLGPGGGEAGAAGLALGPAAGTASSAAALGGFARRQLLQRLRPCPRLVRDQ